MYLTGLQVAEIGWYGGFWGDDLPIAVAVAKAESGWNTTSRYITSEEDSVGLWQINTYAHPQYPVASLMDPDYNAHAAFDVFHNAGYRWTPWTTYTRGTYLQFMGEARSAVNQLRSLGNNVAGPAPGGQRTGIGSAQPPPIQGIGTWDPSANISAHSGQWARGISRASILAQGIANLYR